MGKVLIGGAADRNLRIWIDNNKLKKYNLIILDIKNTIALQHSEAAAGYIEGNKKESNLRLMGEGLTPEEVGDLLITRH